MLPLPESPTDPIKLADWLELSALVSPHSNSSRGDLERALRAAGLAEFPTDDHIEEITVTVLGEVQERTRAADKGYPFRLDGGLLTTQPEWDEYPAYVFCLCLSYFGCNEKKGSKPSPRRWFEHLSRDALQRYVGGSSLRFGAPRLKKELPAKFADAVRSVCRALKEGEDFKSGGLPNRQDDAVDIIAWKPFADELPGKLILFGNCATERDWEGSKRSELVPEAFCSDWMTSPPACKIAKALFIPHRVARSRLVPNLRRAGIIFDRCRISYWTYLVGPCSQQDAEGMLFTYSPLAEWSRKILKKVPV